MTLNRSKDLSDGKLIIHWQVILLRVWFCLTEALLLVAVRFLGVFFRENLTSGYIKIGDADLSNRPTVYSARNRSSTKIIAICRLCAHLQAIYPRKNQPFVCPLLERVAIRLRRHIFGVQTNFARLLGNGTD